MTVSIDTTRLASVITGWGGKLTACSRRSIRYRTLSTNGTTMFRPAGSVSLYLPKRSTTPARACGMIRTVFASSTITKISSSASRIRIAVTGLSYLRRSLAELGDRVDVRRGAADLEDLHG